MTIEVFFIDHRKMVRVNKNPVSVSTRAAEKKSESLRNLFTDNIVNCVQRSRIVFNDSNFNSVLNEKAFENLKSKRSLRFLPSIHPPQETSKPQSKKEARSTLELERPHYHHSSVHFEQKKKSQDRKKVLQGILSHRSDLTEPFSSIIEDLGIHEGDESSNIKDSKLNQSKYHLYNESNFKKRKAIGKLDDSVDHQAAAIIIKKSKDSNRIHEENDKDDPRRSGVSKPSYMNFKTLSVKESLDLSKLKSFQKYSAKDIHYEGRFVYPFPKYSLKLPKRLRIQNSEYNDFYYHRGLDPRKYLKSIFFAVKSLCRLFIMVRIRRERLENERIEREAKEERLREEAERNRQEMERRKREEEEEYERWLKSNKKTRKHPKQQQIKKTHLEFQEPIIEVKEEGSEFIKGILGRDSHFTDGLYDGNDYTRRNSGRYARNSDQELNEEDDEEEDGEEEAQLNHSGSSDGESFKNLSEGRNKVDPQFNIPRIVFEHLSSPLQSPTPSERAIRSSKNLRDPSIITSRRLLENYKTRTASSIHSSKRSIARLEVDESELLNSNMSSETRERRFMERNIREEELKEVIQEYHLPFMMLMELEWFEFRLKPDFEEELVGMDARLKEALASKEGEQVYSSVWLRMIENANRVKNLASEEWGEIGYYGFFGVKSIKEVGELPAKQLGLQRVDEKLIDYYNMFYKFSQDMQIDQLVIPGIHDTTHDHEDDEDRIDGYFISGAVQWEIEWYRNEYGPHAGKKKVGIVLNDKFDFESQDLYSPVVKIKPGAFKR